MKRQSSSRSEGKRIALFGVILLAIVLAGSYFIMRSPRTPATALPVIGADGTQEVRMAVRGLDYEPSVITVRAGVPVRWIVDASQAEGCARTLYSKGLSINQVLPSEPTTITFTPTKTGTIPFSCTMGMVRGEFHVV